MEVNSRIPGPEKGPGYPLSRIPGPEFSLQHTPGPEPWQGIFLITNFGCHSVPFFRSFLRERAVRALRGGGLQRGVLQDPNGMLELISSNISGVLHATEEFNFTSEWETTLVTRIFSEIIVSTTLIYSRISRAVSFIDFEATTHQGVIMIDSLHFRFRSDGDGCHANFYSNFVFPLPSRSTHFTEQ